MSLICAVGYGAQCSQASILKAVSSKTLQNENKTKQNNKTTHSTTKNKYIFFSVNKEVS